MAKPRLGYWDIRGLAQPCRFILAYVGEDFEDVKYACGPAPDFNRDAWFSVKFTLGLPFPNLPYYIDDKVKLTGTNAIFRYLGRKYNLDGADDVAKAECDLMLEQTMDLRNGFVGLCYGQGFADKKAGYIESAIKRLETWEKFLGDKQYCAGDKITVADFHLFEMLDQHLMFEPSILDSCPKLKALWQRIGDLPKIKAYMASPAFKKNPVNNLMANWL